MSHPHVNAEIALVFTPDAADYEALKVHGDRLAEIMLEFMDELLLVRGPADPDGPDQPARTDLIEPRATDQPLQCFEGQLVVWNADLADDATGTSLEDAVARMLQEYGDAANERWSRDFSLRLLGGEPEGKYYYDDGEKKWCTERHRVELMDESGTPLPHAMIRSIEPSEPGSPTIAAYLDISVRHDPIPAAVRTEASTGAGKG